MVTAIIVAGGKGRRMGYKENKVFMKLLVDKEMILYTLWAFETNENIDEIIVVAGENEHRKIAELAKNITKMRAVTTGGKTRQESVYNGLSFASGNIILIHDGARALIGQKEITESIKAAKEYGAAAVGVKVKDTLKSSENGFITGTIDREKTYQIQTPQVFKKDVIKAAHDRAIEMGLTFTDDCGAVENIGHRIKIIDGSYDNIKLTTPEDIEIAEKILKKRSEKI